MDSASNANQPGRSRRLLSRFTLTLTVLLALSFVALAVVGPTTEDAEALTWEEVAIIASGAAIGAKVGAMAGASLGDGIGAVLGAAGGAIIGALLVGMDSESSSAALDSAASDAYASALKNITTDYLGLVDAEITNLNALWNTSQYYLVRKAEYAALQLYQEQTANSESYTYDPYYVLSKSEVANATTSYAWAMGEQLAAVFNAYTDLATSFIGTYDGMSWGFMGGSFSISSTASSKAYRYTEVLTMAQTDTSSEYVTVAANSTIYAVNTDTSSRSYTVTIWDRDGNTVATASGSLANGQYHAFNLADLGYGSGDYRFSYVTTSQSTNYIKWFGEFSPAITSSGNVYPAVLSFYKDDLNATIDYICVDYGTLLAYVIMPTTGSCTWATGAVAPYLFFKGTTSYTVSFYNELEAMETVLGKVASLQTTANTFAQTYYNYLVTYGDEAILLPDVIFPDPSELEGMSWQQIYAIFIAYMTQMEDWFYENNGQFDDDNVTLSAASLNLTCRGAIYDANGTMLYDNETVWTPYISLDDMTLYAGQNNTMTQPGFIIVWATGVSSLGDWNQTTTCVYLPIKAGYNLSIEEMLYDGELADEVTLTVTTVEFIIYEPGGNITPVQITTQTDAEWIAAHWYYLAIAGGVICLLAAMATRNQPVLIAGVVLLAAGAIGWYLAGDSSLMDWFSIVPGPDKMAVWLQGLR